jgi:heme-degrading monooxygenase HmoA
VVTVGLYYQVRPGKEDVFERTVDEVLELLEKNPGHIKSLLYRNVKDARSYAIISEWKSQSEFTNFVRSDLFKQVTDLGKAELLEQRPQHKVYSAERDAVL